MDSRLHFFSSRSCLLCIYSPFENTIKLLRRGSVLDFRFGLADIVKLKDEVSVVYQRFGGILTIDFADERVLIVSGVSGLILIMTMSFRADTFIYL